VINTFTNNMQNYGIVNLRIDGQIWHCHVCPLWVGSGRLIESSTTPHELPHWTASKWPGIPQCRL